MAVNLEQLRNIKGGFKRGASSGKSGLRRMGLGEKVSGGEFKPRGGDKSTMGDVLSKWKGRLNEAHGDGWDIASATMKHAARGAVGGAVIGGTMESAQGGSFWTGAKSGAFNGALAYSGYRTLKTATGATSRNPLSRKGAFGEALGQMKPAVSNQVKAIQRNTRTAQTAGSVMNGGARL